MSRTGYRREGVVVVQAVAPLVVEHAGELAGVETAAARPVEVDSRAVPEGVAGEVDVHVCGQLLLQPAVTGKLSARHLDDAIELVKAGTRGMGVARTA
jgi:hypothetical protein